MIIPGSKEAVDSTALSKNQSSSNAHRNLAFSKEELAPNYLVQIGRKIKTLFIGKHPSKELDTVQLHLSNVLGVIKLLSDEKLSSSQSEHVASLKSSLKSSCDFLANQFGMQLELPIHNDLKVESKSKVFCDAKRGKILLISDQPIHNRLLRNMINQWGYRVDQLSELPSIQDLTEIMNYDLVLISKSGNRPSIQELSILHERDQEFLLLLNGQSSLNPITKKFPRITGPLDPEFLKYKLNKLIPKVNNDPAFLN